MNFRKPVHACAVVLALPSAFAVGETTIAADDLQTSVAKCAIVTGDLDRLSCFDRAAKDAGLAGPQPDPITPPSGGTGKWQVSRDKNPIDDSVRVIARLTADSGQSRFNGPVSFTARCSSNTTEVYLSWGEYLGNDGDIYNNYKLVTVRVGDEKAATERWDMSTDNEGTFAPHAIALLRKMAVTDKLLAQVTPYNESPITAIFDTRGLADAITPLADACEWSLEP